MSMSESVLRQHTELSFKRKKDVSTSTELSIDLFAYLPTDSEPIAFTDSRSVGCQTADPGNLDEIRDAGVIKYSSTRKFVLTKSNHSDMRLPKGDAEQQMTGSIDRDIKKLSLCAHMEDMRERQNATDYINTFVMHEYMKARQRAIETSDPLAPPSTYKRGVIPEYLKKRRRGENAENKTEYRKTNAVSVKARQSVETASNPLAPPSTYKRGVIPKYLQEDRERGNARNETDTKKMNVMSVKARQRSTETACNPLVPPPTYKKGVIPKYLKKFREAQKKEATLNNTDGYETLKTLKKRYSDLVQELKMMPVKTDIRMMYTKKTDLTKKLKETEEAIKVFLKTEACVIN